MRSLAIPKHLYCDHFSIEFVIAVPHEVILVLQETLEDTKLAVTWATTPITAITAATLYLVHASLS